MNHHIFFLISVAHEQYQSGKEIYEVKHKWTFHLSWKQEFIWVALEDVSKIPNYVLHSLPQIETNVVKIKRDI